LTTLLDMCTPVIGLGIPAGRRTGEAEPFRHRPTG
jgi:hypothetical protein